MSVSPVFHPKPKIRYVVLPSLSMGFVKPPGNGLLCSYPS